MNKEKIRLITAQDATDFINICSKYNYDINVYDGSRIIDSKSIVGVFSIQQGKTIEVQMVSSNEDAIMNFLSDIKRFFV